MFNAQQTTIGNINTNTMHTTLKYYLVLILFSILTSITVSAQVSDSEHISRGFMVDNSTIVDIGNKYGDIVVKTWERDTIWVQIDYKVTGRNYDEIHQKMKDIDFELTQSGHYVVINTLIGESKNRLLNELKKLKETIGFGETEVEINMKITLPDNLDLRMNNKFGNIYLDDYNGDVTINMDNGRLKAHNLNGYISMELNFADAIINHIDNGRLEIYYSDMNLASARRLRIDSKTSNITLTEVNSLFVNSSRDDYRIRLISDFETVSSWTDFSISEFTNKSDVRMNYGDLTIENIKPDFEHLVVDANSTSIQLFLDRKADLNFDITTNKDISMPMEAVIDSTRQLDNKDKIMRYIGRTGEISTKQPRLIMKTSSSDISIMKR
ncbi:MAG TPA: hypothetical protein VJ909_06610 [Prolixibacteraceae bacterium]|nr:hypothetical protein [Prolixibacteraceae bacterium]